MYLVELFSSRIQGKTLKFLWFEVESNDRRVHAS